MKMQSQTFECGMFPAQTTCPVGNLCITATGDCISESAYLSEKIRNNMKQSQNELQKNTICTNVSSDLVKNSDALSKIRNIMSDQTITNHCDATYSQTIVCKDAFSKGFVFNVRPHDIKKYTNKDTCFTLDI